jgi:DNA-directed RNA polymerase specialized sigma24 family protein
MIEALYKEVFGSPAFRSNELTEFTGTLAMLPENIYYAIYHYYVLDESKDAIAISSGTPLHMVERRIKSGIALLRAACETDKK